MTLIVALALMAVAMTLSYAVLRTQGMAVQIQANSNLGERARQAAWSGFFAGVRNMHQTSWAGVNTVFNGSVNGYDSYSVAYATGDPSLTAASAQYSDYPYRVTLSITGAAVDAAHAGVTATHSLKAVVRLAPRQLATEPADWSSILQYTVYQRTSSNFTVDWPCRIQGNLFLQGTLSLCPTYPYPSAAVTRYLTDLSAMSGSGTEYRPLSGTITLPYPSNNPPFRSWLTSTLGVSTIDNKHASTAGLSYPNSMTSYQIYRGGAVYQTQQLSGQLKNTTLAPNVLTNPLGLYYANGPLSLQDNVSITGSLVCDGVLSIDGSGVSLQSYPLPPLAGSTQPVHLPAVISGSDFLVNAAPRGEVMQASVQGVLAAFGDFVIATDYQNATFTLQGRLISSDFVVGPRREWQFSSDASLNAFIWQAVWNSYTSSQGGPSPLPFPVWLAQRGLTYSPSLTLGPNPTPLNYHWKNPGDPIYVPGTGDPGLRWDVVSVTDNP